jgi:hypothetical protein
MPLPDLTDGERAELVRVVREAIAADRSSYHRATSC